MCDILFEEVFVVLMFGGFLFFRLLEELIVRLCFVNFDGYGVFKVSEVVGFNNLFFGDFVEKYCKFIVEGIKALKKWVVI